MHLATTLHRISKPVMKIMFVTLFNYFHILESYFSRQAANFARDQVFLSPRQPRDSILFKNHPTAQNILWFAQMSIRVCSTIILILWYPCLALKFRLSHPMRLPPTRFTVAQLLFSFIGLVFYFLAARSVRQIDKFILFCRSRLTFAIL